MFYFDTNFTDHYSGRQIDFFPFLCTQHMWGVNKIAVINNTDVVLEEAIDWEERGIFVTNSDDENVTEADRFRMQDVSVYTSIEDFVSANSDSTFICLEKPEHNPDELLATHTFNAAAWYCIGQAEGWAYNGGYINGSTTLGIEHNPSYWELSPSFLCSVVAYENFRRNLDT